MGTAHSSVRSQTILAQSVIVAYIFDIVGNSAEYLHGVKRAMISQVSPRDKCCIRPLRENYSPTISEETIQESHNARWLQWDN
jgi:hypothetical protein